MNKIIVSKKEFITIAKWHKYNMPKVSKFFDTDKKFPFNKFAIHLEVAKDFWVRYVVTLTDNQIQNGHVEMIINGDKKDIWWIRHYNKGVEFKGMGFENKKDDKEFMDSTYRYVISVILYIMFNEPKTVQRPARYTQRKGGTFRQQAQAENTTYLLNEIVEYTHEYQDDLNKPDNNNRHNIKCPVWGVKGHYRHYKNGKVVFIREYQKGKDRDSRKADKEYKIEKE